MEEFESSIEQDQWAYYMATRSESADRIQDKLPADRHCKSCGTLVDDGPYDVCVACDY